MDVSINYLNWQVTAVANNTYRTVKKVVDKLRSLIILLASALVLYLKLTKQSQESGVFNGSFFQTEEKLR